MRLTRMKRVVTIGRGTTQLSKSEAIGQAEYVNAYLPGTAESSSPGIGTDKRRL